jgi:hypothetical protein
MLAGASIIVPRGGLAGGRAAASPILTANDFGNAEWTRSDKLRWSPPTLINPLEPGVARDVTKPGTGVIASKIPVSFSQPSLDIDDDVLIVGSRHVVAGKRTGDLHVVNGRNVRIVGFDTGNRTLQVVGTSKSIFIEGVRGDFTTLFPERDFLFLGGRSIDPGAGNRVDVYVQNTCGRGIHSTNKSHYVGGGVSGTDNVANVTSIVKSGNTATVTLDAAFPSGTPSAGVRVIIAGTTFNGVTSRLGDFNYTWTIRTVTDDRHFTITKAGQINLPKGNVTASGGRAWLMAATDGAHADGIQISDTHWTDNLYVDKCTFTGTADAIIRGATKPASYCSRMNFRWVPIDPQDFGYPVMWLGSQAPLEFYEVYATIRPPYRIEDQMHPGRSEGAKGVTTQLGRYVCYPGIANIHGVIFDYDPPGGDFANYDALGLSYTSPGYGDMPTPRAGDITDITVDNLSVAVGSPAGTVIGIVSVAHNTVGQIIDVYISSGDTTQLQMWGRRLRVGPAGLSDNSLAFELTAVVRGTSIILTKQFRNFAAHR